MKIGIVTMYYDNANYGGLLQSFALQKCLTILGHESLQVCYKTGDDSSIFVLRSLFLSFKKIIKKIIKPFYTKNSQFKSVLKQFEHLIPHTSNIFVDSNLSSADDLFDFYICGSDQIWNPIWSRDSYFLAFTNKPKASYAASVASDFLTESQIIHIRDLTKDFINVSVREKNTYDILKKSGLFKNVELVPDPTFLLTKKEWEKVFDLKRLKTNKYIFAYFLGCDEDQRQNCINFAKSLGYDIYFVPFVFESSYKWDIKHSDLIIKNLTVNDFVSMIANAELVITDSFHGTVFSCIFETPFFVLDRKLSSDEICMNSRLLTLQFELGFDKKRITNSLTENYEFSTAEKDCIKKNLDIWREKGLSFLTHIIGTINGK